MLEPLVPRVVQHRDVTMQNKLTTVSTDKKPKNAN